MSIIGWNCRGLGNPQTFQFIKDIVCQKKPNILFLCETMCKKDKIEWFRVALGFERCFVVDCAGHSGGVAMFWRYKEEVNLIHFGPSHIDL